MTKIVENLKWATILGVAIWVVGFIVGMVVFAVGQAEKVHVIEAAVMAPLGILFGLLYFSKTSGRRMWDGFTAGAMWLVINLVLDLIVLVGVFESPLGEYLRTVAVSYLFMPVMMALLGFILDTVRPRR